MRLGILRLPGPLHTVRVIRLAGYLPTDGFVSAGVPVELADSVDEVGFAAGAP